MKQWNSGISDAVLAGIIAALLLVVFAVSMIFN